MRAYVGSAYALRHSRRSRLSRRLQVSVAVLLDNFMTASLQMEGEARRLELAAMKGRKTVSLCIFHPALPFIATLVVRSLAVRA